MDNANARIASAPLPTPQTLRRRQSLAYQLWRFVALNARFVTMILKGDH
jgi:hypothetical protein